MKTSELIKKLELLQTKAGDVEINIYDRLYGLGEVNEVIVRRDPLDDEIIVVIY